MVCPPRQRTRLAIRCAPPVDDVVIVGREGGRPPGVPPGRSARSTEVFEVFMVGVDTDRGFCSLQVDPPLLECLHDREQLLVVDGVVALSWVKLAGVVADRVQHSIRVCVGQNVAQGVVGRIRLHCEWQIRLEVEQDRRRCDGELELPERRCCVL